MLLSDFALEPSENLQIFLRSYFADFVDFKQV